MTAFIAAAAALTLAVLAIVLWPLYRARARGTLVATMLALPLAAAALYGVLGNRDALEPAAAAGAMDPQVEKMVATLAARLEREPADTTGWLMLGRSYKVMGRMREAESAYDRAADAIANDAQELASYADIATSNRGGHFAGKPAQILEKALKADPQNAMALWLAGAAAADIGDRTAAIRLWQKLLVALPPDSEDAREVRAQIAQAGGTVVEPPAPQLSPRGVSGRVELAAGVMASPDDVVFVIARAPGQRMPVAVMRTTVASLPVAFRLDDSLAMSPAALISALDQVEVSARVSPAGQALAPGAADFAAQAQTVKVGADGIALKVVRVKPPGNGPGGG